MQVEIRRATEQDIPTLAGLYVEFHNFHAIGVPARLQVVGPPEADLHEAIGKILANLQAALFVACLGAEVVGFVEIYLRETEPSPAVVQRKYGLLQSLAVAERMRRRGLGLRPLGFYERSGYTTMKRTLIARL